MKKQLISERLRELIKGRREAYKSNCMDTKEADTKINWYLKGLEDMGIDEGDLRNLYLEADKEVTYNELAEKELAEKQA